MQSASASASGQNSRSGSQRAGAANPARTVLVRKHLRRRGTYVVRLEIRTARRGRRLVRIQIGSMSRRAITGRRGHANLRVRLAVRTRTLTIRITARGARPTVTVHLRRVGAAPAGRGSGGGSGRTPVGSSVPASSAGSTTSGSAGSANTSSTTSATTGVPAPATSAPAPSAPTGYAHVLVVIEENYSGAAIVGGGQAPYLTGLAAQGRNFLGYHGVSHPSEPNYLALFTGSTQGTDGSDNCISSSAASIVGEALSAGVSVGGYIEGLSSGSGYACRHDPFSQLADAHARESDFSSFPSDFSTLPRLSFVVPNLANDMHDNGIGSGDTWAAAHLDAYAQWAKANNSLLIVLSDENDSDPNYTANQPGENGNGALAIFVGAGITAGAASSTSYDHYSMLRTLENIFGLGHLGASAGAASML